jgi:hypothetical protein
MTDIVTAEKTDVQKRRKGAKNGTKPARRKRAAVEEAPTVDEPVLPKRTKVSRQGAQQQAHAAKIQRVKRTLELPSKPPLKNNQFPYDIEERSFERKRPHRAPKTDEELKDEKADKKSKKPARGKRRGKK